MNEMRYLLKIVFFFKYNGLIFFSSQQFVKKKKKKENATIFTIVKPGVAPDACRAISPNIR